MNIFTYIQNILNINRFAKEHGFVLREVSGIDGVEQLLSSPDQDCIVAVDSTGDGTTYQASNGGMWIRRVYTIFIVRRYHYGDMEDYRQRMSECRNLFRQLHSRMLRDKLDLAKLLTYLDTSTVQFRELAPETSTHYTGLYFMLQYDEPYDLHYVNLEWD